jgi:hypothetical protein
MIPPSSEGGSSISKTDSSCSKNNWSSFKKSQNAREEGVGEKVGFKAADPHHFYHVLRDSRLVVLLRPSTNSSFLLLHIDIDARR